MGTAGADLSLAAGQLVPCIVQDAATGEVLMLAYQDDAALEATRRTGLAHFHSRSRNELWLKGATSGNTMAVVELLADCDADTVLLRVRPAGPACHTGEETCFGPRRIDPRPAVLAELAGVIEQRRGGEPGSYVAAMLAGGREQAQRKVGEEAVEVLLAEPGSEHLVGEVADLWFHTMLLLARDGIDPLAPLAELRRRRDGPHRADR